MEDNKFASRKFILTAFVVVVSVGLVVFGTITPSLYYSLNGTVLALYFTGNVADKLVYKP